MPNTLGSSTQDTQFESDATLDQFIVRVPTVTKDTLGKDVKEIFSKKPEAEGVIVLDEENPVGLIMRTTFFQKLGSLYGNSLFMGRPIEILMDTTMLTVDSKETVANIGISAMNRSQDKLYDYIVVLKNKSYAGVISVRMFLIELSKRNEAQIEVLKFQQQQLLDAHRQEVDLRNSLISKSHTVKNLLNHAGQGFLLFGADLVIKEEFSAECTKIFKKSIAGENYIKLIEQYFSEESNPVFYAALNAYFENASSVTDNVYLMLLPQEAVIEEKNIHFEYKRIENDSKKSVMVILNDITEQKTMEKTMQEEQNTQRLIIKVLTYQGQIKQMLAEFTELFGIGYKDFFANQPDFKAALNDLYRAVHTFKGDFAQYGFVRSSDQLHVLEDRLYQFVSHSAASNPQEIDKLMAGLNATDILKQDLHAISEVLGEGFFEKDETISIPQERILELERAVEAGPEMRNKHEINDMFKSLQRKNIKMYLYQQGDYLNYLSQKLLKNCPVYVVEGDDIYIDPEEYKELLRSLVHIYRNIMDHGLETPEERLACGKPEQGVVLCRIQSTGANQFCLSITDDGQGIDTQKLRSKAQESQFIEPFQIAQMTEPESLNLIFLDHLSTKDKTDTLSGRGIGMAAVKNACEKLGGRIEVSSQQGRGTTFTMILPCSLRY